MQTEIYQEIETQIENFAEAPADWQAFFASYANKEEKLVAYYVCAIKYPDLLQDILLGYHGKTYSEPAETIEVKPTKTKSVKANTAKQTIDIINQATGQTITVAPAELTKADNLTGVIFSKPEKDKVIYYNKTVHGWKRVDPYVKPAKNS